MKLASSEQKVVGDRYSVVGSGQHSSFVQLPAITFDSDEASFILRIFMKLPRYILGSRSPQRLELLRLIVPAEQIDVVPPLSTSEPDFAGLDNWFDIRDRVLMVARGKLQQVAEQLDEAHRKDALIITADTVITAPVRAHGVTTPYTAPLVVLGQPPADDSWRDVVRHWFTEYYAGQTHLAVTAVCVTFPDGRTDDVVTTTEVTMRADVGPYLDWYLDTGEPRGKAGGYALQGAGSIFIERVEGSLSNVIGLPLEALWEVLQEAQG